MWKAEQIRLKLQLQFMAEEASATIMLQLNQI